MGTSLEIKILTLLAASAAVYAFVFNWRSSREYMHFVDWVRGAYPLHWHALHWLYKFFAGAGAEYLYRHQLKDDAEFEAHYRDMRGRQRAIQARILTGIAIGVAAIGLVAIGTRQWGWVW